MTVTKQQQLEWLATYTNDFFGMYVVQMSGSFLGSFRMAIDSKYHIISREEWQQERDKMQKKVEQVAQPTQDNSWYEREELPPVGYECEAIHNGEWVAVEVLRHRVNNVEMNVAAVMDCTSFNVFWSDDFRPLRTEREKTIDEMNGLVGDIEEYPTWRDAMAALYDAGYRKVASK